MSKKPVLLCIMDGFGWTPNETYGNAVVAARKPLPEWGSVSRPSVMQWR